MKNLYLNTKTESIIKKIICKFPQSLLITGKDGVGLLSVAKYISEHNKVKPIIILPEKDDRVDIEKGIITIDIIRRLYADTRTKINSKRIYIIDYAERMNHQSQNAFLKLLEEPNDDIYFILLSHSKEALLPTVLSRVQILNVMPISSEQSQQLLDDLGVTNTTKRTQFLFIADGMPAELTRLAYNPEYFTLRSSTVKDAKELLQGNLYEKLRIAHNYREKRSLVLKVLLDAAYLLEITLKSDPKPELIGQIERIIECYQQIEQNSNIRLCIAKMVI